MPSGRCNGCRCLITATPSLLLADVGASEWQKRTPRRTTYNAGIATKPGDVTALLKAWGAGDDAALHLLVPLVEVELRRLARACLHGERPNHSLQATALVNEAFLRLVDVRRVSWKDRVHFLSMTARVMRRVLVDAVRVRRAEKRGGGAVAVTFDEAIFPDRTPAPDLIALNDALEALTALDARKGQGVELRFFAGLSARETAGLLGVSEKTILRDWEFAKAWLHREMTGTKFDDA
jgi:RNA polymerase sigma factor (TIGR02999 family)